MRNPYFIDEPAAISFSGGRTSAFMLYKILEAHDGKLPDFVKVLLELPPKVIRNFTGRKKPS